MIRFAQEEGITDPHLLQGKMLSDTTQAINDVKLQHRSHMKLEDWSKDCYFQKQSFVLDLLLKEAKLCFKSNMRVSLPYFQDTIERVNYNSLTENQFIDRYEFGSKPVIIQGVA